LFVFLSIIPASYIGFSQGYSLCSFDLQFCLKSVVFAKNFGSASAFYLQPELLKKKLLTEQTIDLHYLQDYGLSISDPISPKTIDQKKENLQPVVFGFLSTAQ
jgi:hypothetical protein